MSAEHLSDLACLEWVRFAETRLAPESGLDVRTHLEKCPQCRAKAAGFQKMESEMHPYGTPAPVDRVRRTARIAIATLLVGVAIYVVSLILS